MSVDTGPRRVSDGIDVVYDLRDNVRELSREPTVFASVGTDHHAFDRLVGWLDQWQSSQGGGSQLGGGVKCRVTVQYGTSRPPAIAGGDSLMAHPALQAAMWDASAIVTHGGPATIRDARRAGLQPLVVPRDPALGEHVDDHQIRFTRMLAERGEIVLCREQDQLFSALDRAVADNTWLRLQRITGKDETSEAVDRVTAILDEVIVARRQRRARPRVWRRG